MLPVKHLFSAVCSLILLAALFSGGCSNLAGEDRAEERRYIKIATSISIFADIIENIAGENARVYYLVPRGDNPEDHELLPGDLQKINDADILFLNGWGLEKLIEGALGNTIHTPVVYLTENIKPIPLAGGYGNDPHVWFNPRNVIVYAENIFKALVELNPARENEYRLNAEGYIEELKGLDAWIAEEVSKIPAGNRIIIVSENAFKYFGEAYGFQTEGIWELNAHEEGTPYQMSRIVDLVREKQVPALFVETTIDSRYMEIITKETGIPLAGKVYTDALGVKGSGAETYLKMMQHNVRVFVEALK